MKDLTNPRGLVLGALVAAVYVSLVMLGVGYAFGPVQFRVAEALTLLPFLFPQAVPGLFAGCALANLLSNYGPPDVIFGSLATLAAALLTARCPNRWLAAIPPVIINALVVGLLITLYTPDQTAGYAAFGFNALTVGLGQTAACFGLGVPLLYALERSGLHRRLQR